MTIFLIFLFGMISFAIAIVTGRAGLGILISLIIWVASFTILNMQGGHFNEALGFALGLSMFVAVPCVIGALIGSSLYYSKSKNSDTKNQKSINEQ